MVRENRKLLQRVDKLARAERWDEAIDTAKKLLDHAPEDRNLINQLGDLYLRKGDQHKAVEQFLRSAQLFEKEGFVPQAIALCKKTLRLVKDAPEVYFRLGQLYAQQGLSREAAEHFKFVGDKFAERGEVRKALDTYRQVVNLDPENLGIRYRLAELYYRESFVDDAVLEYINIAAGLVKRGSHDEAMRVYRRAVSLNPEHPQAIKALATLLIGQGHFEEAAESLAWLAQRQPDDLQVLFLRGTALGELGEYSQARTCFEKIVKLDPDQVGVRENLAALYLHLGDTAAAFREYLFVVDGYLERGEWNLAEELLRKIVDHEGMPVEVLDRMVMVYQRLKDQPGLARTYQLLGTHHVRAGETDRAINVLEELLKIEPDNREVKEQIAKLRPARVEAPAPRMPLPRAVPRAPDIKPAAPPVAAQAPARPSLDLHEHPTMGLHFEQPQQPAAEARARSLEGTGGMLLESPAPGKKEALPPGPWEEEIIVDIDVERGGVDLRSIAALARGERAEKQAPPPAAAPSAKAKRRSALGELEQLLAKTDIIATPPAKTPVAPPAVPPAARPELPARPVAKPVATPSPRIQPPAARQAPVIPDISLQETDAGVAPPPRTLPAPPPRQPAPSASPPAREAASAAPPGLMRPPTEAPEALDELFSSRRELVLDVPATAGHNHVSESVVEDLFSLAGAAEEHLDPAYSPFSDPAMRDSNPFEEASVEDSLHAIYDELVQKVSEKVGDNYESHYELATAYKGMGLIDEAIRSFRLASGSEKLAFSCASELGICFFEKGMLDEAIQQFERALSIPGRAPRDQVAVRYELALALEQKGQHKDAFQMLDVVVATDPAFRDAKEVMKRLRKNIRGNGHGAP
ncbi:MAG: tetratricopeptide repeat protein [Candidatus Schekmanbacteria bacterium]|nr:tetratricopeptide repeat protein [Candidatus Schekmanbacteria bacterium]